ncbi:iron-sulfur cluster assembly protein [Arcobacter sp. 15-2]|uniref:metal-sulfur cluster assembly factor n=1 Tax=Arcobacter sp. 15-2 TaxID=3374109 RepID=UPI00399CDBF6
MGIFNKEEIKEKIIEEKLKKVFDPEIPINIYDLGLIYKVELEEKDNYLFVKIEMTLTSPACPVAESLLGQVKSYVEAVDEVDECTVDLVFDPQWDKTLISEEGNLELMLSGINL